jgi:small conductance mechanosensitive channel
MSVVRLESVAIAGRRVALLASLFLLASIAAQPAPCQEPAIATDDSVVSTDSQPDTLPNAADRARSMLDTLAIAADSLASLDAHLAEPDVDLHFLRALALEQVGRMQGAFRGLGELTKQVGPDSVPIDSVRTVLTAHIHAQLDHIDRMFASVVEESEDLSQQRSTATADETGSLEVRIRELRQRADTLLHYQERALVASESLGLELPSRWESYDRTLQEFADGTSRRLQVTMAEQAELRELIRVAEGANTPESDVADLRLRVAALQVRLDAMAENMEFVTDRLENRGFETAAYEEVLVRATGEVTGDVLDPQVLWRLGRRYATDGWHYLRRNLATVFVRLLIVGAFIVLFRVLFRVLWSLGTTFRLVRGSRLVTDLIGRLVRPVATLIGLLVGLSVIGLETTTLLAGLGIAGLVVGLALQDSLSNLFAGLAILASHAFDVDDVVEVAGAVGKIQALGLWNTTLVTFDGRRLLIPNHNIWGSNVENRSVELNRRADAVARIGYDTDLQAAIGVLEELLEQDERVLEDPAPRVWVSRLDESWAEVKLWAWARTPDWWALYSDLPRMVRLKLSEAGIEVPVPRRDVTTRVAESGGESSTAGD